MIKIKGEIVEGGWDCPIKNYHYGIHFDGDFFYVFENEEERTLFYESINSETSSENNL
jgi:hypothetical protein